eukprot:gene30897-41117_t
MDLANAFGLLNILPSSVHLVANELTDNITMLYIVGLFGWTGTPYAFDVVTRSIRWGVRRVIRGEADMYVDDLIGCSLSKDVADDIRVSASVIRSLCGPDLDEELIGSKAMEDNPDIILDSVAGHKEGYGKVGFMGFTLRSGCPVDETIHRRSARVHEELRQPFRLNTVDKRSLKLIRNLDSFVIKEPTIILQFDASLTGVGIVLTGRDSAGTEGTFALGLRFPYSLGSDSSFQNVSEFMAVLAGIFLAIKLFGTRGQSVKLYGDSKTWSKNEHYRETEHVPGIENVLCDDLSRDPNRSVQEQISGTGYVPVSEELTSEVTKLLDMCNSNSPLGSDQEFRAFWEGDSEGIRWQGYLQKGGGFDPNLRGYPQGDRARVLVGIIASMRTKGVLSSGRVANLLATQRHYYVLEGVDYSFLDHPILTKARAASNKLPDKPSARRISTGGSCCLVIPPELIVASRPSVWSIGSGITSTDLDRIMIYFGVVMAMHFLLRVSEYAAADKGNAVHCFRASEGRTTVDRGSTF